MRKPKITLSINPWYFCNFDCSFCYLTKEQLRDRTLLDLDVLKKRISEVEEVFTINCVDIYGGEVSLLEKRYLDRLLSFFSHDVHINIISNLSFIADAMYDPRVTVSVSWEGDIRRKSKQVLQNMRDFRGELHLLMLVSEQMIDWSANDHKEVIETINSISNIKSVELKPYSSNQANDLAIKFSDFEDVVKIWFSHERDFLFVNEENLRAIENGVSNSFSDDHLYITPKGKIAVLDFDENDNEFFKEVESVENYLDWANKEKVQISKNSYCSQCEYFGRCLSEHLREVKDLTNSCNGFYNLIEWYKKREV